MLKVVSSYLGKTLSWETWEQGRMCNEVMDWVAFNKELGCSIKEEDLPNWGVSTQIIASSPVTPALW